MASATGATLATTHRMSDGVHGYAANVRSPSSVPVPSGFANTNVLMVDVSELPDSSPALDTNHA